MDNSIKVAPNNTCYFIILGYSRSGKSTAAEIIAKYIGSPPHRNCSDFIINDYAIENAISPSIIISHKEEYRNELFLYGQKRQIIDPTYPILDAFKVTNVVTGVRTVNSLNAIKDIMNVIVVWIDRDTVVPNNTDQLDSSYADIIIKNNKSIDDLSDNINKMIEKLKCIDIGV